MPSLPFVNRRDLLRKFSALPLLAPGLVSACSDPVTDLRARWRHFQKSCVMKNGRIIDTGNRNISHSEGQGMGLLFAQATDDVKAFLRIYDWTKTHLQVRSDRLFAWKYNGDLENPVTDFNNASDGDIYIAWALLCASEKWGKPEFKKDAGAILEDLRRTCIIRRTSQTPLLLPGEIGFNHGATVTINLSYYVFPAFQKFSEEMGDPLWDKLLVSGLELIERGRFGKWQLPSNWVDIPANETPSIAANFAPQFSYDAIRIPLFLHWIGEDQPYESLLSLSALPDWIDLKTGEPSPTPMPQGGQDVLALIQGRPIHRNINPEAYYSQALSMLCQMVLDQKQAKNA